MTRKSVQNTPLLDLDSAMTFEAIEALELHCLTAMLIYINMPEGWLHYRKRAAL